MPLHDDFSAILRALGTGASIVDVCARAGLSRAQFDARWRQELADRASGQSGRLRVATPGIVEILRDQWGIPHIMAETREAVFFGVGFAMSQDRLWQMDYLRRKAQGRLAEIVGPRALDLDLLARTVGFHRIAEAHLDRVSTETRDALQCYADGVNAEIMHRSDRLPIEFALLDYMPERWTPLDSLAILIDYRWYRTGRFPVIALADLAGRLLADEGLFLAFLTREADDETIMPVGSYGPRRRADEAIATRAPEGGGWDDGTGSNNWVISGERTASGKPLLASDPHLPFSSLSWWYETHVCGGGFNVAGVAQVGVPGIMMGRNERVAWGQTNNICSQRDLYRERTDPAHPGCFLYDGNWEPAREIVEEIRVRGSDIVKKTIRFSRNGPIVDEVLPTLARDAEPISLRWVGTEVFDETGVLLRANRAHSCEEFRDAYRSWGVPTLNLVFADVDGHIGYQAVGHLPLRTNWERGFRPGWDPAHQWTEMIPYTGMPALADPSRGWIVTANNRNAPPDFPYPLSGTWNEGLRARRIRELLEAEPRWTADGAARMQMDTLSMRAADAIPHLARELRSVSPNGDPRIPEAMDLLESWDCRMEPDAVGAVIFEAFFNRWCRLVAAERFDGAIAGVMTGAIPGLAAALLAGDAAGWFTKRKRASVIREALAMALDDLESRLGPRMDMWKWGDVHTLTLRHPLSGIGELTALLDRGGIPVPGSYVTVCNTGSDAGHAAITGAVFRLVADMSSQPPGLYTVIAAGASGDPGSDHYCDQLPQWRAGQHHWIPLDRDAASVSAVGVLNLVPRDVSGGAA
jgi:penicillin amidase